MLSFSHGIHFSFHTSKPCLKGLVFFPDVSVPQYPAQKVLTVQFNLETDLPQRMAAHEEHERTLELKYFLGRAGELIQLFSLLIPCSLKTSRIQKQEERSIRIIASQVGQEPIQPDFVAALHCWVLRMPLRGICCNTCPRTNRLHCNPLLRVPMKLGWRWFPAFPN